MSAPQEHGRPHRGHGRPRKQWANPLSADRALETVCPWRWVDRHTAVHGPLGQTLRFSGAYVATLTGGGESRQKRIAMKPGWTFSDVVVVALIWAGWEEPLPGLP